MPPQRTAKSRKADAFLPIRRFAYKRSMKSIFANLGALSPHLQEGRASLPFTSLRLLRGKGPILGGRTQVEARTPGKQGWQHWQ